MIIPVKTSASGYNIILEKGAISKAGEYLNLDRKTLIVTDSGVPKEYSKTVAAACKEAFIFTFPEGEASKNFDTFKEILEALVKNGFTRTDCIVAVGGGVAGDMAGFAAACFMRGIDFYNIPTTVLSQVDSSIGGKTAIDFCSVKNIVGAFYPPKCVIIDTETLSTLPKRQISNGLAESVKMALTFDEGLFSLFEDGITEDDLDTVIERSLYIKKRVVEEDEKESGLRKTLNFGHTVGHAIEVNSPELYHGECVALGMLPMCSDNVRERLIPVLESLNLPISHNVPASKIVDAMSHDKKKSGESITAVRVEKAGSFILSEITFSELEKEIRKAEKL
ncbi:MAG: 3-dehydroquinate synthase [Clostridia bacterium]|nr:3-dehydroquinate synthase [Clostridia bacterium]